MVADMDRSACSEGLFEDRPSQGGGGGDGGSWLARGVAVEAEQRVKAPLGGVHLGRHPPRAGRPRSPW